jgi:hypothetical protein
MDMVPMIVTEPETRRGQIPRDHFTQIHRTPKPATQRRGFWGPVRRIFVFLLGLVILTMVVRHLNEINTLAAKKISQTVNHFQVGSESDQLRQSARNYEKEVEQAAQ